jgi:hypothetical protein
VAVVLAKVLTIDSTITNAQTPIKVVFLPSQKEKKTESTRNNVLGP